MTARRGRRAKPVGPRRPRAARGWWWLPALGIAAGPGAWWWLGTSEVRPPIPSRSPWSRMDPRAAYETGVALINRGEGLASLPYLRHALARTRERQWEISQAIFAAAMNASFAASERFGTPLPATRSSVERIQLVREALEALDDAERAATAPRELATIRKDRAQALLAWGFGWEAFLSLRDAQAVDPTWDLPGLTGDTLMAQLEYPAPEPDSR